MAIPAETKVAVFVGAANRDERRWGPTANEYEIARAAGGHLAFGMGIHQCVGQPLSRLEVDVLITELSRRVKSIELTAEPEQFMHTTLRCWKSIPVRVAAALSKPKTSYLHGKNVLPPLCALESGRRCSHSLTCVDRAFRWDPLCSDRPSPTVKGRYSQRQGGSTCQSFPDHGGLCRGSLLQAS